MSSPPVNLRPAPFALGAFAFLMPFVTMSGEGVTFSGMDMTFGGTGQGQYVNGEPLVLIALALCASALYLSFGSSRDARKGAAAAGAIGAVLLMVTQSRLQSDVAREGMAHLSFRFGYWLALVSTAAGAGLGAATLGPAAAPPKETRPRANTDSSAP